MKLPGDAIYVIGKEIKDALSFSPEMYLLSKKEYTTLMARIEQLERLLSSRKPAAPSSCKLTGQVDGEFVHIQVRFDFTTTEPKTLVALGCQRAWPTAATIDDGKLPLLVPAGEDGWNVQVDNPGAHTLILDLELVATNKEGEVSFTLGLPRAAITNLEQFTLPVPVPEVRLSTSAARSSIRSVKAQLADAQHSRLAAVPLGDADRLSLAWKNLARQAQQGPSLLTSEGLIRVQVEESHVIADVELDLRVRRGETDKWRIQVPAPTALDLKEPQEGKDSRVKSIKYPTAQEPILTIELKEPSAESLRVVFQVRQPWDGKPSAIGPFVVLDAFRQWGTIRVVEPADARLRYRLHGDVTRREVAFNSREQEKKAAATGTSASGGENLQAEFAYWNLNPIPGQPLEPPLEIEKIPGNVETKVEHELRLTERGWQVLSKFKVTPIRSAVDRLELSVDPDLYDAEVGASIPNVPVEEVAVDAPGRKASIKIPKQIRPFILTWPGLYRLPGKEQQQGGHLKLELPRCLQTLDRGGQITAVLPPEGWELVPEATEFRPGEREYTWRSDRAPLYAELTWRPYRPELAVESIVDLTLGGHQARVRQQIHLQWSQTPASLLRLAIPAALKNRVRLETKDAKLQPDGAVVWAKPLGKERSLFVEYSFPLPASRNEPANRRTGEPAMQVTDSPTRPFPVSLFDVPLVGVEAATHAETKVRIWCEPGIQPALVRGPWEERPTEVVEGQASVPTLVLRSIGTNASLLLRLEEMARFRPPDLLVDRTLLEVGISPEGFQTYRARFLVARLNARRLDIHLPDLAAGTIPQVLLGGQQLPVQSAEGNAIGLATEPELFPQPTVLEIRYKIVSSDGKENGTLRSILRPPAIKQAEFLGPVRWEVAFPQSWISFFQGGGLLLDQRWVWQGGMFTPVPAMSRAELDRWLTGSAGSSTGIASRQASEVSEASEVFGEPSLVCQQVSPQPLVLLHVSRQMWLLACSLVFLVVGLVTIVSSLPRVLLWAMVAVVGLAGAAIGIYWPGLLTALIYGCEPGIAVLAFILAIQWMLHERYRRRVVFLPGFTRVKQGTSVLRAGTGDRSRLEPSTVDAPPPAQPDGRGRLSEVKGP
jgi:hypothetical protein